MDIFKLIYEHDLRLDDLRSRHTDRKSPDISLSIEDFMKPDLTFSKFYITGSRIDQNKFGLNILDSYPAVMDKLQEALSEYRIKTDDQNFSNLPEAVEHTSTGSAILLTSSEDPDVNFDALRIDSDSNVGHRKQPLSKTLKQGHLVLYKEQAHHGFDLHLFSMENIYRSLFFPLQELVSDQFRFFSINGKRITSERKFFFETWTLDRPPHGAEEVFEETVL